MTPATRPQRTGGQAAPGTVCVELDGDEIARLPDLADQWACTVQEVARRLVRYGMRAVK